MKLVSVGRISLLISGRLICRCLCGVLWFCDSFSLVVLILVRMCWLCLRNRLFLVVRVMLWVLWWNRCMLSFFFRWVICLFIVEVLMLRVWVVLMMLWVLVMWMKMVKLLRLFM